MSTKETKRNPAGTTSEEARIRLPREVEPERDLWSGIAKRIDPAAASGPLAREIEPHRDLWPGIRRRLDGSDARARESARGDWARWLGFAGWAVAAAALVLAFQLPGREGPAQVARTDPNPLTAMNLPIDQVQANRKNARVQLRRVLLEDRSISTETRRTIERNLATIDQALREIQQALAEDPGNATLYRLLHATYRQEAEIVAQVTRRDRSTGGSL